MIFENLYAVLMRGAQRSKESLEVFNPFYYYKQGTRGKAILALVAVCLFWGLTWVASKVGVQYMPALQLAGIRQFLAGAIYVSFFLLRGEKLPKGKQWRSVFILSFLNFMMSNGLSTWGVKYISAGMGAIMGAIFPLWLVIIGLFASKEKLPRNAILGLLLGFGGVCTIFYDHMTDFLNPQFQLGISLSLVATWTWAFATLYTKQEALSFNPYFSLGLQMLVSGTTLFFVSEITGQSIPFIHIPWEAWSSIAFLIVFGSLIAFTHTSIRSWQPFSDGFISMTKSLRSSFWVHSSPCWGCIWSTKRFESRRQNNPSPREFNASAYGPIPYIVLPIGQNELACPRKYCAKW
jgi:drug/metabolite transporter (DMT)-like permease